ncbi:uncharacterized protein LOC125943522 [Dermacentor silvarum]|uniref:uncharacterized protein LOC125943522 n=1 Tax=Dermacentor silvarum TaxID=543639 RepID=UPI002101207E|nr:uncharacterized protein LOC125943522 [Dermacentor silvarum]
MLLRSDATVGKLKKLVCVLGLVVLFLIVRLLCTWSEQHQMSCLYMAHVTPCTCNAIRCFRQMCIILRNLYETVMARCRKDASETTAQSPSIDEKRYGESTPKGTPTQSTRSLLFSAKWYNKTPPNGTPTQSTRSLLFSAKWYNKTYPNESGTQGQDHIWFLETSFKRKLSPRQACSIESACRNNGTPTQSTRYPLFSAKWYNKTLPNGKSNNDGDHIWFLETSYKRKLGPREACSIESACRNNGDYKVNVRSNDMEHLRQPEPLRLAADGGSNWKRFRQQFEFFLQATVCKANPRSEAPKTALLLSVAGEEALDVLNNIVFNGEENKEDYNTVIAKFEEYVSPPVRFTTCHAKSSIILFMAASSSSRVITVP